MPQTLVRRLATLVVVATIGCGSSGGRDLPVADGPPATDPSSSTTSAPPSTHTAQGTSAQGTDPPRNAHVEVLGRVPHATDAFTQGLELDHGFLIETTGGGNESDRTSTIRRVDPTDGTVSQIAEIDDRYFGEGVTRVGDTFVWLTFRENTALVVDRESFEVLDQHTYEGQGWGLCLDGDRLIMSNGTAELTFRDPDTFEPTGSVTVTRDGAPLLLLNELECVDGDLYANVWRTDEIVRIDPGSGEVVTTIDASGLLTSDERAGADVLNGIAYDPDAEAFLVTGKDWPWLFEVRFVPSD